jgi:prevent-host-death family protein
LVEVAVRRVSVTEARRSWSRLLAEVEAGEEVAITRYGRVVARLAPALGGARFPDRTAFRASIPASSVSAAEFIRLERDNERY